MDIKKILTSWWLRGHLFLVLLTGLVGFSYVENMVMAIQPHTIRKEIKSVEPTRAVRVILTRTATAVTRKPTSIPTRITTITPTKVAVKVPTAAPITNYNSFNWPDCYNVVTQYYGQNGEQGTDFGCYYHTRLTALWGGTIQYAGRTCWNVSCTSTSGGVVIILATVPSLGLESTYYLHVDGLAPGIFIGQHVSQGQFIALSGGQTYGGQWPASPQFSEGPHLEIGMNASFLCDYVIQCHGVHVNPLPYIQEVLSKH